MKKVLPFFPISTTAKTLQDFIITSLAYVLVAVVVGLIAGVLGRIPIIGFVFSLVGWLVALYSVVGVVLAALIYLRILKE